MNKNIKLAVAGAVLALGATAANAGIIIPAGEWSVDLSGNVNAFYTQNRFTGGGVTDGLTAGANDGSSRSSSNITTGLLPNFLSLSASTRQNDLDTTWLISINPGGPSAAPLAGGSGSEFRQAYFTFGDKSWGSVKLGKDLGIYASDAILNDMTLLGVGAGGGNRSTSTTTLGRIGSGFMYADWKEQVAYTTPNFSGFQATVGVTQAWNTTAASSTYGLVSTGRGGASPAFEGKASYAFASGDSSGKIWVSGFSQKVQGAAAGETVAWAGDIGFNANLGAFGLTGYYYGGEGVGITAMLRNGYTSAGAKRDSDGGYIQATYTMPSKTKIGLAWGQSNLDLNSGESVTTLVKEQRLTTVGIYHPLTQLLSFSA